MNATQTSEDERAKRLMAMGQMAASLAHEIRNPLGSMELFCTLLKKDLKQQPQLLVAAEQIHVGIRTLDRIISNCLQFTRDIIPRKITCGDVTAMLDEVRTYVEPKAKELRVELVINNSGRGQIDLDSFLVNQVLVNLLINAVEAAGENKDAVPTVTVDSTLGETGWLIAIQDNGRGISAEDQRQIFDPFFTTKQGGTGLGLTIVYSIVRAHGGTLEIESSPAGTRAEVRFPSGKAAESINSSAAEVQCGTGG